MLQIRIANIDGTDPIILETATNRKYSESIDLSLGGISFEIAKNSPKVDVLNPYTTGYTKRWEVWDTATNTMLNFGPISQIDDNETTWKVQGPGRVGFLEDFRKTKKTFYQSISRLIEDISYENIAIEPRTSTLVVEVATSTGQTTVFGPNITFNEKYHGLSKNTRDNAIDDNTGHILPNAIEPPNTFYSSDSYWSGMSKADTHIIDLGGIYEIKKMIHTFPDWGGPRRARNRAYDYEIAIATDEGSTTTLQDREFGTFDTIYSSPTPNKEILGPNWGGKTLYIGLDGATVVVDTDGPLDLPGVPVRYIRTKIRNVHAWLGSFFDSDPAADIWDYECDPNYVQGSNSAVTGKARMKGPINDRVLEPANDCHASIAEVGAYKEIVNINNVEALALQRIDNENWQIKYDYNPVSGKTVTTSEGYRKFEPGSLFRRATITWSGAGTSYTKFFDDDCSGCYPDGFHLGVMDQNNSLVYAVDNSSGTAALKLPAFTKHIMIKGASNATVTHVDAWPARTDQLSFNGSYSYNEIAGDSAIIHFRGRSFRWYATVPENKTGATCDIEIRQKDTISDEVWSTWTLLDTITLPSGISSEVVYEITFESGRLDASTTYEIRITNNDGNFCSIDSIEGYWSSSMSGYNEDSTRVFMAYPEKVKQIYDKRFSNGSMYKWGEYNWAMLRFTGDRVVITSAKGRNHGIANIILIDRDLGNIYDPGLANHVFIPGGDPTTGTLEVDLDTGKTGNEIPQYIVFDSDDYFEDTGGLPWGRYVVGFYMLKENERDYTSNTADIEFDSFVERCKDCNPPVGDDVVVKKPVFLDGIYVHEVVGLSVSFENETHLDILRSILEAIQSEGYVDATGINVSPRIGTDTDVMLREGENTLVSWQIVNDISQVASMLVSNGADIDGLPLFAIVEDKKTFERLGRTVMRQADFRSIASYFQLIGLSRTELHKRAYPEKRITVSHIGHSLGLGKGDSFLLWTKKLGSAIRVRIENIEIDESNGRVYNLECVTWPQIV